MMAIPQIVALDNGVHHLMVDGKPFLMRAAELNNSSMSSADFMEAVWPRMKANNVNTVLGAVGWDQVESEEGVYDFSHLRRIIQGAESNGLKLVFLWFGSFKNASSSYVPGWVKRDPARFPRIAIRSKDPGHHGNLQQIECLSTFSPSANEADAAAFSELMRFLRDEDHLRTVIMVQVENEAGVLGDSRDRSVLAEQAFRSAVPAEFLNTLRREHGSLNESIKPALSKLLQVDLNDHLESDWETTFGASLQTDELFMAYHLATYVEKIAKAGKDIYPLPLFANAWLKNSSTPENDQPSAFAAFLGGGADPGDYPSGGPVETVLDVWQLFAPTLDFLGPDIYLANYAAVCKEYRHRGQPLFIPEQRCDLYGALRMWTALANHKALGVAPFGIDSHDPSQSPFTLHYGLLKAVGPLLLDARTNGRPTAAAVFDAFPKGGVDPTPNPVTTIMGYWAVSIMRMFSFGHPDPGFGMIVQLAPDTFFIVGEGVMVNFTSTQPNHGFSGIINVLEKEYVEETHELRTLRLFNGDEVGGGKVVMMPYPQPDYNGFPISSFIPAGTRMVECSLYALPGES